MKFIAMAFMLFALSASIGNAQLPAPRPPDTVFLEELTWDELRELMRAGKTTAIIATAGTEQKGPHMVIGEHRFALEYTADKIARALGNAIVAPIITHVPEGNYGDNPDGHMRMAGTISLPNDRFMILLEHTARSLKGGGFKEIILIGDSGGNQNAMRDVAAKLNTEWKGTGVRLHWIGDYYEKAQADQRRYMIDSLRIAPADIGNHAGMMDTSELLFINESYIRKDKLAPQGGFEGSGVSGDPTKASKQLGARLLQIKIDNAVAQIKASIAAPPSGVDR